MAKQQGVLILPWVQVPHLASHLLGLATRRLSADWQARHGHPVWLGETFVESDRLATHLPARKCPNSSVSQDA